MEANTISGVIIEISISAEAVNLIYFIPFQILLNWQWELRKNNKNGWALSASSCSQNEQEY